MGTVGIEQARLTLGDIIDKARMLGEPTAITRHGKAAAVVVSAEWYEHAKALMEHERPERTADKMPQRRGD